MRYPKEHGSGVSPASIMDAALGWTGKAAALASSRFFQRLDEVRRMQGRALEGIGFGPHARAARVSATLPVARLLAYQAPNAGQPAMLIVPAPIKKAYIWDLMPGFSAVERCLSAGMQVYLADWQSPKSEEGAMGLAAFADRAIRDCIAVIREETGQSRVIIAGHSLGGTLAAIFSSLHPQCVRALVTLEGPIAFGPGRLDVAAARGPRVSEAADGGDLVAGTFLDWVSACADPYTFLLEPLIDWIASSASSTERELHLRVRRWMLDETPMPGRLFVEVVHGLYRENRFAEGKLEVAGRLATPQAIEVPIFAVCDRRSRIVPWQSIEAHRRCTRSRDTEFVNYDGDRGVVMQHIGVLVGRNAHTALWPKIAAWMRRHVRLAA